MSRFLKNLSLCLLAALAFAGCNKKEDDDDADTTPAPATPKASQKATPAATPASAINTKPSNDWMWKNDKGKDRDNDPLKIKTGGLDQPAKK